MRPTTATTVAAAATIGAAGAYGAVVISAALDSTSAADFAAHGDWGTVISPVFGAVFGGLNGYSLDRASQPQITGRGTQNPKVKAAIQKGQEMHKQMDYGPGVVKEKTIAPGCRVDGIDFQNQIIYELKPNNPQAIARGTSQLAKYISAANEVYGGDWTGVLKLYD